MIREIFTVVGVLLLGINHGIMQAYLNISDKASGIPSEIINLAIPTTLDILIVGFLSYGIIFSKKLFTTKIFLIFMLIALSALELYYVYTKPKESLLLGQILLYSSTIFKLYILITLHCDVTSLNSKNYISKTVDSTTESLKKFRNFLNKPTSEYQPKPQTQTKVELKELKEPKPEADIIKANQIFNEAIPNSTLTPEEIEKVKEAFRAGLVEENPWNTLWNTFNNSVVNKISDDVMTSEQKNDLRNKFKVAMGKTPKTGGRR